MDKITFKKRYKAHQRAYWQLYINGVCQKDYTIECLLTGLSFEQHAYCLYYQGRVAYLTNPWYYDTLIEIKHALLGLLYGQDSIP